MKKRIPVNPGSPNEIVPGIENGCFKLIMENIKFRPCLAILLEKYAGCSKEEVLNDLVFLNTELKKEKYEEKGKVADIIAKVNNKIVNLEANTSSDMANYYKDVEYYHKIIAELFKKSDKYSKIEVSQINFNTFVRFEDFLFLEIVSAIKQSGTIIEENMKRIHLNVARALREYEEGEILPKEEKILAMFATKDIKELYDLAKGDGDLMAMKDIIEDYNSDPNIIGVYNKEDDKRMLMNGLKDEYFEKGTKQNKLEIARNMLKMKLDIGTISKATGLTKEEIRKI